MIELYLAHIEWAGSIGYTPFLDPLAVGEFWLLLLVPLVLAIAIVYKAIKLEDLSQLPRQVTWLSLQIVCFMVLAAAILWLLTEFT